MNIVILKWGYLPNLIFDNQDKTKAFFEDEQTKEKNVYTLMEDKVIVSVKPYGGWKQGTYVRQ